MYLNDKEEQIIGKFMNIADDNENKKMILKWKNYGVIYGVFDSYIEDESECDMDEEGYEEFWSFVFKAVEVLGNPPVYITEDEFFCVDYRNFPDEIVLEK